MIDLFKALFGIPTSDSQGEGGRFGSNVPNDSNNYNNYNNYNSNRRNGGPESHHPHDNDNEDDEIGMTPGRGFGFFDIPFFEDPFDFHKQFDKLVKEMHKSMGMFGFGGGPSISWEDADGGTSSTIFNDPPLRTESLRDAYLKQPDCGCESNISVTDDISSRLTIDNMEPGSSGNPVVQYSSPKIYSKSVFIQSIRKPDGSIETIKKVRDHTGNEETTITQTNVNDPLLPSGNDPLPPLESLPELPNNDTPGLSLLRKFFRF